MPTETINCVDTPSTYFLALASSRFLASERFKSPGKLFSKMHLTSITFPSNMVPSNTSAHPFAFHTLSNLTNTFPSSRRTSTIPTSAVSSLLSVSPYSRFCSNSPSMSLIGNFLSTPSMQIHGLGLGKSSSKSISIGLPPSSGQ